MSTDNSPSPEFGGRSFYGYDSADVQAGYADRDALQIADFLVPHLSAGMSLLDCGCGPGPITLGLAKVVSPGRTVGIDVEPTMIDWANRAASSADLDNIEFRVASIYDLPFEDDEFDVVFSSAVTEHLSDPVGALREIRRVTRTGGLAAVIKTDWSFPFIVPECPEFSRFFELFEGGFNRIGGSLNRGRFLKSYMMEAGFEVTHFETRLANSFGAPAASSAAENYITWLENIPLFRESIDLGITTQSELDSIRSAMREWAQQPAAYVATAGARAIGIKN